MKVNRVHTTMFRKFLQNLISSFVALLELSRFIQSQQLLEKGCLLRRQDPLGRRSGDFGHSR